MGIINQLITGGAPPCIYRFRSDSDDHCFGSFRGTVENVWDPVSLPWFCLPCLSMGNNILHTWETTCAFYCKKQTHLETIYSKTHVYNCIYIYIHIHIYIYLDGQNPAFLAFALKSNSQFTHWSVLPEPLHHPVHGFSPSSPKMVYPQNMCFIITTPIQFDVAIENGHL